MIDPPPPFGFLDATMPDVAADLALDEALLIAAEERDAGPVVRVWEARRLAVILGASCRLHSDVEVDRCQSDAVPIFRRSSGGGTVVIGPGALNVAVVVPGDLAPGLAAVDMAQSYVLGRTAAAIRQLGLPVDLRGSGDLVIGDRKFAGSAQRRLRRHFLVHTSILYAFDLASISRYTRDPVRQPTYRLGRAHGDFVTNVPLDRAGLLSAVRSAWLDQATPDRPPTVPTDLVDALVRDRFSNSDWTTRL